MEYLKKRQKKGRATCYGLACMPSPAHHDWQPPTKDPLQDYKDKGLCFPQNQECQGSWPASTRASLMSLGLQLVTCIGQV